MALSLQKYEELFGWREIDKSKLILARGEEARFYISIHEPERFWKRIKAKYPRSGKRRFVMMIELLYDLHYRDEWDDEDNRESIASIARYYNKKNDPRIPYIGEDEDPLSVMAKILQREMMGVAVNLVQKYGFYKYGITPEELKAEFELELVRLAYQPLSNPNFTFYEALNNSYSARAKDYVRREWGHDVKNKQRKFEVGMKSLDAMQANGQTVKFEYEAAQVAESFDPTAKDVELKIIIEQWLHGDLLTDEEKSVLAVMYDNGGDASNLAIGRKLGIDDKKVKRIKLNVMKKIQSTFGEFHELI